MSATENYIFIEGLEIQASVGIYDHEKKEPQALIISLTADCLKNKTFQSDNIHHTINYEEIIRIIHESVKIRHYNLIETLAETIASSVLEIQGMTSIIVEIRKPSVLGSESKGILGIKIKRHL